MTFFTIKAYIRGVNMGKYRVFATVKTSEELLNALKSSVEVVFMLSPTIEDLGEQVKLTHKSGKKLFIHIDFAKGIAVDEYGLRFVKKLGVDGIVTTRTYIVKKSKKMNLYAIQRFFVFDSHSIDTMVETIKESKPEEIEIMPAAVIPKIVKRITEETDNLIIAGGLVQSEKEIAEISSYGVNAVTTSRPELWNL